MNFKLILDIAIELWLVYVDKKRRIRQAKINRAILNKIVRKNRN